MVFRESETVELKSIVVEDIKKEIFIVNFPILSAKIEKLNKVYHKKAKKKRITF